ncbi:hypothetical protein OSTOST_14129, partial [Ostertagia ostertagi]
LVIGRIVRGDFSFYTACGRALSYVPLCALEDVRNSMIRWLSRLGSPSPSPNSSAISESPRKESVSENWSVAYASDPSEWERKFGECWTVAEKILDKKANHPEHDITYNEMTQLVAQLTRMCQLLMMEVNAQPEPAIGPILDRYFTNQIMEMVLDWAIQVPDFLKPTCQVCITLLFS